MSLHDDIAFHQFVKTIDAVEYQTVSRLFSTRKRRGIYLLVFANAEIYIGKTKNITARYRQHLQNHPDIATLHFKTVRAKELDEVERHTVLYFQQKGYTLRNISLTELKDQVTKLDDIVSPEDQERWMRSELPWETLETERKDYPEHRLKYSKRFQALKLHPDFEQICVILQDYIQLCTPFPRETEFNFWSVSCLPDDITLARVSIHWQETLSLVRYFYEENGEEKETIAIRLYVSKSSLLKTFTQHEYESTFKSLYFDPSTYKTGGKDQQCLTFFPYEFPEIIGHDSILEAAKSFNLSLMRKGPCKQSRFHCYDLADEILRTDNLGDNE